MDASNVDLNLPKSKFNMKKNRGGGFNLLLKARHVVKVVRIAIRVNVKSRIRKTIY